MNSDRANKFLGSFRHDYAGTSVNSGQYLVIAASLSGDVREIEIFDSSGRDLILSVGAEGQESGQNRMRVFPGGLDRNPVHFSLGQRLSIAPVGASADSGVLIVNMWG